jgi:uncharacterized RDD family membrane protein YckC
MAYEALLIAALLVVATFPFVGFTGGNITATSRYFLQFYLLAICATYFTWFWTHGGQTLPMKTWRIRLISSNGAVPSLKQSLVRYVAALFGISAAGIGLIWALHDSDRQFLHDRIAGTRLVESSTQAQE